jgi:hypothetical protein
MLSRLLVVIACYGLSCMGMYFAVLAVAMTGVGLAGTLTIVVWFIAAWAHLGMSRAWIANVRLGAGYSRRAFAAGIAALLVMPVLGALGDAAAWSLAMLGKLVGSVLLEALLVFPAVVLAAYLNRFHAAVPGRGDDRFPAN